MTTTIIIGELVSEEIKEQYKSSEASENQSQLVPLETILKIGFQSIKDPQLSHLIKELLVISLGQVRKVLFFSMEMIQKNY